MARRGKTRRKGIVLGISNDAMAEENTDILALYRGKAKQRYT
jgi:hypothetical protein